MNALLIVTNIMIGYLVIGSLITLATIPTINKARQFAKQHMDDADADADAERNINLVESAAKVNTAKFFIRGTILWPTAATGLLLIWAGILGMKLSEALKKRED